MFENPRRGRQARNFTTNVPKILDLKSSSEQIFSKNCRLVPLTKVVATRAGRVRERSQGELRLNLYIYIYIYIYLFIYLLTSLWKVFRKCWFPPEKCLASREFSVVSLSL